MLIDYSLWPLGTGVGVLNCSKGNPRLDMIVYFLTMRMGKHWNKLPQEIVESSLLEILKKRLGKHLFGMDRDDPALARFWTR